MTAAIKRDSREALTPREGVPGETRRRGRGATSRIDPHEDITGQIDLRGSIARPIGSHRGVAGEGGPA